MDQTARLAFDAFAFAFFGKLLEAMPSEAGEAWPSSRGKSLEDQRRIRCQKTRGVRDRSGRSRAVAYDLQPRDRGGECSSSHALQT